MDGRRGCGGRGSLRPVGPTLARSVRQVDFVICLYTTLPVPDAAVLRESEVWGAYARTQHRATPRRAPGSRVAHIDVESLRYFTAISVMNIDLF